MPGTNKDITELMRSFRFYEIDRIIREGNYPNVKELAGKVKCSERTIHRDLDSMRRLFFLDIPALLNGGYYYTEEDKKKENLKFYFPVSQGELFAIGLIEPLLCQYKNTPIQDDLITLFNKIITAFPHNVTVSTALPISNVSFISDSVSKIEEKVFTCIMDATLNNNSISFDYQPLQKTTTMNRHLNPYHIVCQRGNWYVLGFCHDKNKVRVFNFSRIKNIKIEDVVFDLPPNFKLEDYFDPGVGVWLSSKDKMNVKLLFDASIGTFACEHIWHPKQIITQYEDGSVLVEFVTNQIPEVKRWILGQGKTVKVLEPPELIQQITEELQASLDQYLKN